MDDQTVDKIFAGSLGTLPPVSSKIVRIFTSSTFTGNVKKRGEERTKRLLHLFHVACFLPILFSTHLFGAHGQTLQWNETH